MPKDENVLDQFSEEFASQDSSNKEDNEFVSHQDALDEPAEGQGKQQSEDDDDLPRAGKNRREKRLLAQLDAERRSGMELAAKLAARSEYDRFRSDTKEMSVDERLLTLYGHDENGRKAAELTQSLLEDTAKRARQEALEDFRSSQQEAEQQVDVETNFINERLEDLEEEHGIDLTSNQPSARKARSEFLDFVERLSPKDKDGDIIEFADFDSTFDEWQARRRSSPSSNRAKDLASRGMGPSGSSSRSVQTDVGEKFLKDSGII